MPRVMLYTTIVLLGLTEAGVAQTTGTGTISGRVLSEDGRNVRAIVTLQFAAARGFPALPRRVFAGSDGSFAFQRLPAAQYTLCAQIPATETPNPNTPFLDTCAWGPGHGAISLAAGQQTSGVVLTAPKGALLKIRVVDPDSALPALASAKAPATLEPELQLIVRGPERLNRHAQFVSKDGAGRNYQMVVPANTALGLTVTSSVADVSDENGKAAQGELPVQAAAGAALNRTFTLHRHSGQ